MRARLVLLGMVLWLVAAPCPAQSIVTHVVADDGVLLATDVYLPFGNGPWPVVLVRTTYGKEGDDSGPVFALLGYACVIQDTRGLHDSGGTDTVFRDDGDDGRATVEWILEQSWCDGNIGTFGGSALGVTQYMLAPGAGPGVRCLAPVVATPDLFHHAMFQGGALREALVVNWLEGQGSAHFLDEVRGHRLYDDWWAPGDVVGHAEEVTAAGLHIGGWYDIFSQGTVDAFTTFQARGGEGARRHQALVMGPWTHGLDARAGELRYPSSALLDVGELLLPWYEYWLKGRDTGVAEWPPVYVFLMGAVDEPGAPGNEWRELQSWPPATATLELYLEADGLLTTVLPRTGELTLVSDPASPVPTLGGANLFPDLVVDGRRMGAGPHDQRPIEDRDDVLTFTTPVLEQPLTVMGRLWCRVWVRPDTPDLDLAVRLTDVYPDGRSMLVSDGIQRARFRCGDDRECLLTPGEPAEIIVDLWSTALVFNAGHRIRVDVSGSNAPRFEVNLNHGGDLDGPQAAVVARPELLFGSEHPSRLSLPVGVAPRRPARRPEVPGPMYLCIR